MVNETKRPASWSDEAKQLLLGLENINRLLKAADQVTRHSEKFVTSEKKTVQLAYDIDDVMAAIELGLPSKPRGRISGILRRNSERSSKADLQSSINNLQAINKELSLMLNIKKENRDSASQTSHQDNLASPTASTGEDLPQMENEVKAALLRQDLPVVCIWRKSGMGKTTLAKKAFYHAEVRRHFQVFAWVPINQDFQTRKVLQDILLQLLPKYKKEDVCQMDEVQLSQQIFNVQKKKRCLIVLENIGSLQDWKSIRVALLIGNSTSKILITIPSRELGEAATSEDGIYHMKPLNEENASRY